MYTIDDHNEENLYEDGGYESSWQNNRGLIFKIIIIILCVIVLIWLIKALKSNKSFDNGSVHLANAEKIRLAAEDYFFIKNNKDKVSYVSLAELKRVGLISDVVDANNKVCNDNGTNVNLDKEVDSYKMTVKFSCSTNDKNEVFYYHKNTLACLNCSGNTRMNGKTVVINDDTTNTDNNRADIDDAEYSCLEWSTWSPKRENNPTLIEREKVMVTGVKYGNRKEYGEWSDYTTTPVNNTTDVEIETKVVTENVWSEPKTGTNIDIHSQNIKVLSSEKVNGSSGCKGYIKNGACYSNKTSVGNLTYSEYLSGDYDVKRETCSGVKTLQDKNGLYVITYLDCEYNKKIFNAQSSSSYTRYTYQELEVKNVTYYRYRTVKEITGPDEYTYTKMEEKDLPNGFVKLPGSEETFYSYKLLSCEK